MHNGQNTGLNHEPVTREPEDGLQKKTGVLNGYTLVSTANLGTKREKKKTVEYEQDYHMSN